MRQTVNERPRTPLRGRSTCPSLPESVEVGAGGGDSSESGSTVSVASSLADGAEGIRSFVMCPNKKMYTLARIACSTA